jgi:NADP-dependent 3-hydroxy acid dehydrogenase YdfG
MAKEPRSLQGKVVAITGGARGIGKATAIALSRKGAKLAIGDLDLDLAQQTANQIGGETLALELDVTSRSSFEGFLDQVEERLGSLDVLVNNAGIMPVGPFVEESDETARKMIEINVHGVLYGMKLALPRMQRRNSGHIINLASQAGKGGFPGGATYCGTKHFVVGASEAVRQELRDTEIEISCVMPALVNTELTAGLPLSRGVKKVEPEDVADAIVDALEFPKFDVWVPRVSAGIFKVMSVLPRPAREALGRALNADKVLAEPDAGERAAYEARAARPVTAEPEGESEPERSETAAG